MIYTRNGNNLNLESASFGGGRINKTSDTYETSYFITDHLGSVRAAVNQNGTLTSTNNYYPFGLRWNDPGALASTNRWFYNGHEQQAVGFPETAGILDYGWRMYYPRIARMKTIDPMATSFEEWAPFVYALNNPVAYIDLQGLAAMSYYNETRYVDEQGFLLFETNDGLTDIIVIPDSRLQEFEAALNKLNEEGEIDDEAANKKELHPMGEHLYKLKDRLKTGNETYDLAIFGGYEEGYKKEEISKGTKIKRSLFTLSSPEAAIFWSHWDHGENQGKRDRNAGRINKVNPTPSLKNNKAKIKIKEK